MKKILLLFPLTWSTLAFSQLKHPPAVMTNQIGGRYEIVQSEHDPIYTFKLDKYEGRTFMFVTVPGQPTSNWIEIPKTYSSFDTVATGKINYQLFLGTVSGQCILMNINTGITWMLKVAEKKMYFEYFRTLYNTESDQ